MFTVVGADTMSVLLSFRAGNVRSFRDDFELSLLATTMSEEGVPRTVQWDEGGRIIEVLPAACMFGANGSGKSNVLRAMEDMRRHVLHSFRSLEPGARIPRRPFLLDPVSIDSPSKFEIELVLDGIRHHYGFSIDDDQVVDEWAYRYPHGRAALLFKRDLNLVEIGSSADRGKGRAVLELLRPNALFLSTAAAAGHPVLLPLYEWFGRNFRLAEAASRGQRWAFTIELLAKPETHEQVLAMLRAADLGITDASTRQLDPQMLERLRRAVQILAGLEDESEATELEPQSYIEPVLVLKHRGLLSDIEFDPTDESLGTLVWLGLIGPVVHTLTQGSVLLADELESSLHPTLVRHLVGLFQDPSSNPRGAQLIFNSHEATLLGDAAGARVLGRDQIWFTEKRHDGSTRLYALSDLGPRKEEAIGRRYLTGRYGAVPVVSREEFAAAALLVGIGLQE